MWIVISFIFGVLLGGIIMRILVHRRGVGRLIIDFTNPMNDQPFLLELNKSVNDVYKKKYISLKVTQK